MATYPVIEDVYRCALKWSDGSGHTAVNVIHVKQAGVDSATIFADLDANVTVTMWGYVTDDFHVTEVAITPLDGVSATTVFPTGSTSKWRGSATSDFIPASCSLVHLGTDLRGRSHRGRIYLPYLAEGQQAKGVLAPAGLATWQAAWDTFRLGLTALLVVASYKLAVATEVTQTYCEPVAATQRRRQSRLR